MPVTILIGAQWGDEGKGRVVDDYAARADIVARYNGGDNAGHTIVAEGRTLALHLVPSGILYPQVVNLIGAGTVVNPLRLLEEIAMLEAAGIPAGPDRIKLAAAAHLILPTHRALDGAHESRLAGRAIGTTQRGIGPAYADKAARINLRAGQMRDPDAFAEAVEALLHTHNAYLEKLYGLPKADIPQAVAALRQAAQQLAPYLVDGAQWVAQALAQGKQLLCEGAQGTLLDLDHGTYPYVTSSSTIAGGALTGLGFGPGAVQAVIGVAKAYTTRVGAGPFPTELLDETGERLRRIGHEYGTTTGRPRRCGWLDAVILRYAAQVNGLTGLALTKLDVLSGLPELKIAVAYDYHGERVEHFPAEWGSALLAEMTPIYETLPGWQEDLSLIRRREDLPAAAQVYLQRIEALTGVPIVFIGVGPDREAFIR